MKKNLLALVAVLVMVALAASLHKDPARASLESDLRGSLEQLWGTTGHQVETLNAKGGVVVRVKVDLPKQCIVSWNEPFVRFVTARHPGIPISGVEVSPSAQQPASPRIELLRRQTQALVDGSLGAGRGLILLEGTESAASVAPSEMPMQEKVMERKAAVPSESPHQGAPRIRSNSNSIVATPDVSPGPAITQECLVLTAEVPNEQVRQLQAQIQAQVACPQFRLVKLPAL